MYILIIIVDVYITASEFYVFVFHLSNNSQFYRSTFTSISTHTPQTHSAVVANKGMQIYIYIYLSCMPINIASGF